jgi:hypothetical protein
VPNATNDTNSSSRRLEEEEDSYDAWLAHSGAVAMKSPRADAEDVSAEARMLSTETCGTNGDLREGTYYIRTLTAGVVKDVNGNPLPATNWKNEWSFSVVTTTDTRVPSVVFATAPTIASSGNWGVAPTMTGYVYFSEKIVAKTGGASITLTDCGTDLSCETRPLMTRCSTPPAVS